MRIYPSIVFGCLSWLSTGLAPGAEPPPRVVAAWAAGPMEARVAFDRVVDPGLATRVVGESIGFGEGEKPGSTGRPGGDRGSIRVASGRLLDDGRTLALGTDPHPREATYRLALVGVKSPGDPGAGARVEVGYDLGGVEVAWAEQAGANPSWSGWWPVVDPGAVRQITADSAQHARVWPLTLNSGLLTLRTLVILPKGNVLISAEASGSFEGTLGFDALKSDAPKDNVHRSTMKVDSTGESIELSMTIRTGEGPLRLRVACGDEALARPAFVLPWAPPSPPPSQPPTIPAALRTGGDPTRGEAVFFGDRAKCASCHKVRGKGGIIGPDLSNLAGRDRPWVYQNIVEPSASIHPDYVSFTVAMKDGRIAMGVVRAEGGDKLKVGDIDAKQTVFPRDGVEELRPSVSSIMPVGLLGAIGEDQTRDLLAFLTDPAPKKD